MRSKILIISLMTVFLLSACNNAVPSGLDSTDGSTSSSDGENIASSLNAEGFSDSLSDWIEGSDFGIVSGVVLPSEKSVVLSITQKKYDTLGGQDKTDIQIAVVDILLSCGASEPEQYTIILETENERVEALDIQTSPQQASDEQTGQPDIAQGAAVNLIFIHHSCGENWLNDGLNKALNDNAYHVADISYGWDIYGDNTDTADWPIWFTDNVMNLVYNEKNAATAQNSVAPASTENEIIMFKSCYPNSDVGSSTEDEKEIYRSLIPYFESHSDKMFILITPPPMINISSPASTRELCNWLADREKGWLADLSAKNVFVFDFYNVLTHPDAHHYLLNGQETHVFVEGANELYYDSNGDDHPSAAGNEKATDEFMSLLSVWRDSFLNTRD